MELLISIENFEDGENVREINSPRSLEACLRAGFDPKELYPKPRSSFRSKTLTKEMIDIKYETFEKKRKDKIDLVKNERNSIIQFAERTRGKTFGSTFGDGFNNDLQAAAEQAKRETAMIEMEERRYEALRRRQEKELQKMIEKEQALANLHLKLKRAEDEEIVKKKEHDKKVQQAKQQAEKKNIQRLADLAKHQEQEAAKRRLLAKKESEFDKKMKQIALENEKRIATEARQRDMERTRKVEEFHKKVEESIQAQIDKAEMNRTKMAEREARVQEQLQMKITQKKEQSAIQKEKAEKRIEEALSKHHELHEEKKRKFEERKKAAYERAQEKSVEEAEKLKKQADEREKKNRYRIGRLVDAYRNREQRREDIVKRRLEKDKTYGKVKAERDAQIAMLKFSQDLRMSDKLENVERVARVNEFKRLQTMQKLHEEDGRYDKILKHREETLQRHREEQKHALTRKHEITSTMELMRITNDFTLLDKLFAGKKSKTGAKRTGRLGDADGDDDRLAQTM